MQSFRIPKNMIGHGLEEFWKMIKANILEM